MDKEDKEEFINELINSNISLKEAKILLFLKNSPSPHPEGHLIGRIGECIGEYVEKFQAAKQTLYWCEELEDKNIVKITRPKTKAQGATITPTPTKIRVKLTRKASLLAKALLG